MDDSKTAGGEGVGRQRLAANVGPAIEVVNVLQPGYGNVGIVSFYAAGIGVMFLLFSASGAGGSLLDEEESGTLGRLVDRAPA